MTHEYAAASESESSQTSGFEEWLERGFADEYMRYEETRQCPEGHKKLFKLQKARSLAAQTVDEQDPSRILAEEHFLEEAHKVYSRYFDHTDQAA